MAGSRNTFRRSSRHALDHHRRWRIGLGYAVPGAPDERRHHLGAHHVRVHPDDVPTRVEVPYSYAVLAELVAKSTLRRTTRVRRQSGKWK